MKTEVKENKGSTFTTAVIVAHDKESLDAAIDRYFRDYIPAGYSTQIVKREESENCFKVEIRRYSNCD